ncbi:SDR family oxidoreductase [Aestuariicella hydrocarbonica]|uniref:SDR family oxidoreductase n=1 Tax=Pseudomaricurvus hydrocarbonicus TaxID=1470433 RepID=A0A9E5T2V6_9GAMM|nr:SDR family oxidoreductase [Aestuariicella hydrocarbonica]NHO68206.1 SDR family oxidoreductase [Aestuariicella hydrocarbonica]
MTTPHSVTLLGCGDIGERLAAQLPANYTVVGLRRSPCQSSRIDYRQADSSDLDSLQQALPEHSEIIVITLTPSAYSDEGYRQAYVCAVDNLIRALDNKTPPRLILFVSSTSVYGQSSGEWVDEHSATHPQGYAGARLLEAEQRLQDSPYNTCVVRFSGIYGPGRHRLIQQVRDGKGAPAVTGETPCDATAGEGDASGRPLFSNRIHVDDCAGVLAHLIQLPGTAPLYLASDCEPSALGEVKQWLATQMGYGPSHLQPGPEASSRASKRCRNQRLLDSGYRFRYPTYQEGYRQVLELLADKTSDSHRSA